MVVAEGARRLLGNLFELEDLGPQELKENGHEGGNAQDRPVLRIRGGTRHPSDEAPAPAKANYVD